MRPRLHIGFSDRQQFETKGCTGSRPAERNTARAVLSEMGATVGGALAIAAALNLLLLLLDVPSPLALGQ